VLEFYLFNPLLPAKAGTQVFFLLRAERLRNLTTKGTKNTKSPQRSSCHGPLVSFVCFVVKKAWVPAFAGMSGEES
jgi:hypothetical protein